VAHRKAVLMVRQNLNPDSAYADVALHGDGLTSLQYRLKDGQATAEVRSTLSMPELSELSGEVTNSRCMPVSPAKN